MCVCVHLLFGCIVEGSILSKNAFTAFVDILVVWRRHLIDILFVRCYLNWVNIFLHFFDIRLRSSDNSLDHVRFPILLDIESG
jgi:hypothetical protein